MEFLQNLYLGSAIFSLTVMVIDIFGLLNFARHDNAGGTADSSGHSGDADAGAGADTGDGSESEGDYGEESSGGDHQATADEHAADHDGEHHGDRPGSVVMHDQSAAEKRILGLLSLLRGVVYFCLGFGPTGWFALYTGETVAASLYWSLPMGVFVFGGVRLLQRIQRRTLDSIITEAELVAQKAEVLVSIDPGQLGRVRVFVAGNQVDRFARAREADRSYAVGTMVEVIDYGQDCLVVSDLHL